MVYPGPPKEELMRENLHQKKEIDKNQAKLSGKHSGKSGAGKDLFQDRFYSILEHVKFVVYQYSIEKNGYLYISPQAYSLFGYTPDEFIKNPSLVRKLIHPDSFKYFKEHWKKLLRGEVPDFYELKVVKRNNEVIWVQQRNLLIRNQMGEPEAIEGVVTDITERKQIDEELKLYSKKLTEQNEILRIINEELVKAKERAVESDRLKSSFLANMSHEIRTPMNAILGFSDLLKSNKFSDERKERFIEIINSKSRQLLQIITDIIDISKIEAGQIIITSKNFSINDLIRDLEMSYHSMQKHEEKPIQVVTNLKLADENSWIYADKLRIEQILTNFLSNAYKFTEKGEIELGYLIKEDNTIVFHIRDTGIGISKDEMKYIFDRFRQVSSSYDRIYGGTGLGLSISRGLAGKLGGSIWVESKVNKGSTFYLRIPYTRGEKSKKTIKETPLSYNWENKTILIAEDEDTNYSFLEMLLRPTRAKIIRAINGLEAVEKSKDPGINLVLMDIKLPELDGLEATKIIKKSRKTLPIIAQTAYAMSSDEEGCLKAGCDGYIAKPIKIDAFLKLIDQFL